MNKTRMVIVGSVVLITFSAAGAALAQGAPGFAVNWSVMGAGGRDMASQAYAVRGTVGQMAAGSAVGASHALHSGYWSRMAELPAYSRVYLPLLLK